MCTSPSSEIPHLSASPSRRRVPVLTSSRPKLGLQSNGSTNPVAGLSCTSTIRTVALSMSSQSVEAVAPIAVRGHPSLNVGAERIRIGELQRVPTGPSQVKRFGHAALKTPSLASLAGWYAETLGLLVSDDIYLATPEEPVGRFMRCDRGDQPADHHTLLIIETGEVRLGHCAWEVADFDDLMAGHDHLLAAERQHYWGVGRHVLGGQVFDYWKDPLGFTVEHWTDSDLLTADTPAGAYGLFDPINQWGPAPPPDLDF